MLAHGRCPVFFSSTTHSEHTVGLHNRYDIFSSDPLSVEALTSDSSQAEIEAFREHINRLWASLRQQVPHGNAAQPFVCGLLGFLSYDYGLACMRGRPAQPHHTTPLAQVGYYTWSYVYDHCSAEGVITFSPLCSAEQRAIILERVMGEVSLSESFTVRSRPYQLGPWRKTQDFDRYAHQFEKVQHYIHAGDVYQVNLAQGFDTTFIGSIAQYFVDTKNTIGNPYSAYMGFRGNTQVCSFSPEQFIQIRERKISSRPIKGTSPATLGEEGAMRLYHSEKNRAENLMIVDLLRNDLSKSCQPHSVRVPKLFELERFSNVHHLVSTIEGTLRDDVTELDALLDCFPGGSITGAPKKRAMEIINELEASPRGPYCGSMFYCNDNGQVDSNILIRTVVHHHNTVHCWGGGGIVADSELSEEYEESLTKVNNITGVFENNEDV